MLHYPNPILNGISITHEELRALHGTMRETIRAATSERCLDGPRLLFPELGERYVLNAYGRDRDGNLLASVSVYLQDGDHPYIRWARLVRSNMSDSKLKVKVARKNGNLYS